MKTCSECGIIKSLDNFNRKASSSDGLQGKCRKCQNLESRTHYTANTERYLERNTERRVKAREIIRELKDVPCADCMQRFPTVCMDFDHAGDKVFNVAEAVSRGMSEASIRREAKKCEVVCSNCHRLRTWPNDNMPLSSMG